MKTPIIASIATAIIMLMAIGTNAQQGVGIGASSNPPLEMLDVEGAIKIGTDFTNSNAAPSGGAGTIRWNGTNFQGWDGTQWVTFGSSGTDNDWVVNGNTIYNANAGNVGIGTSTPTDELYVANPTNTSSTVTVESGNQLYPVALKILPSTHANSRRSALRLDDWFILQDRTGTGAKDFAIYQNSALAQRFNIDVNGNVGIGDQTPDVKLDVEGSIQMVDGNQQAGYIPVSDANGTMAWTDPTTITTAADGDWTVSGNDIFNSNSGNIGLGTSTPDRQLNIESATGPQMLFTRNDNNTTDGELMGELLFDNNDDTTPSTVDAAVVIRASASGSQGNSNKGGYLSILTKNNVSQSANATERMRVTANGNIGIGTTTPADKLQVQGSIRMVDGNQAAGYVPVSDANGKMTWTDPTTITTAADGDGSSTNELQTLSISGSDITLSNGGGTVTIPTATNLQDGDSDTKVQVEEASDEDIIRFDLAGTEYFAMQDGRLNVSNTGRSVFIGEDAGLGSGLSNRDVVYIGYEAGKGNTGNLNVAVGFQAMSTAGGGSQYNTAVGSTAMQDLTTGDFNSALGNGALRSITTGGSNTAIGMGATQKLTDGGYNVAIGRASMYEKLSGNSNVAIGYFAGENNVSGSGNVFLGTRAGGNETGSNKLYVDNSNTASPLIYGEFDNDLVTINGSLGVGITPVAALHVSGTGSDAASGIRITGDVGNSVIYHNADGNLIIRKAGQADQLVLAVNGNVGVGTSLPTDEFYVANGSGSTSTATFETGSYNYGVALKVLPSTHATSRRAELKLDDWSVLQDRVGNGVKDFAIYQTSTGSQRFNIDVNGNVGIGFETPTQKLHVADGTVLLDRNTDGSNTLNKLTISGAFPGSGSPYASIDMHNLDSNNGAVDYLGASIRSFNNGGSNDGDLTFYVASNQTLSEAVRIDHLGNVGIGTPTPNEALEVTGSIRMNDGNQSAGFIPVSDANGTMTWTDPATITTANDGDWTISGSNVYRSGVGNVGIGQNNPSEKLHVGGNLVLDRAGVINNTTRTVTIGGSRQQSGSDYAQINFINYDPNDGAFDYTGARISTNNDGNINDGALSFHTADNGTLAERMTIQSGGYVGVGTTAPSSKLHITDERSGFEGFVLRVVNTANSNSDRDEGMLIRAGHDTYNSGQESSLVQFEKPNGTYMGRIRQSGSTAVEYVSASDERLKTNIVPTVYGLENLMQIEVKDYSFKDDLSEEGRQTGFLAQQLYQHYPKAVDVGSENVEEQPWGVAYGMLTPLLVKAVQDLKSEKDQLQEQVQSQQTVIEQLLQRVSQLEQQ